MADNQFDRGSQYVSGEDSEKRENPYLRKNRVKKNTVDNDEDDAPTVGKTENFGSRNVKTITFLVCLAIFLAVLGPISIFRIVDIVGKAQDNSKPQMTMNNVVGFSEAANVSWNSLKEFRYEDKSTKDNIKYVFTVSEDYEVWATGSKEKDKSGPAELILICWKTGGKTEIRGGDIEGFLEENDK